MARITIWLLAKGPTLANPCRRSLRGIMSKARLCLVRGLHGTQLPLWWAGEAFYLFDYRC